MINTVASPKKSPKLVTCALPYANNHLHLGHFLEYIQADIWVRSQRFQGQAIWFLCGDDTHGAPIMLQAAKEQLSTADLLEKYYVSHREDLNAFGIAFDCFGSTHTPENQTLVEQIYAWLKAAGHIEKREIEQLYDTEKKCFLPDRFVRVTCPRCQAKDQYGDNCEQCGAAYQPELLLDDVRSALSDTKPLLKKTEHIFFQLHHFQQALQTWISATPLQSSVRNKLQEWFSSPLKPWDISRDKPYFGFLIPGEFEKYFYVWLDAPIAYLSMLQTLCQHSGIDFANLWAKDSALEMYHFIGKDIVYFHSLFWPALLMGIDRPLPTNLFVHGYVTINGEKMSKSRGTFIEAKKFRAHLPCEALRYYYASKLNASVEDVDLNLEDCIHRFNADVVNSLVNLASRSTQLLVKHCQGQVAPMSVHSECFQCWASIAHQVFDCYQKRLFGKAIHYIMQMVKEANQKFQQAQPWKMMRSESALDHTNSDDVRKVCTEALNCFKVAVITLGPVLPTLSQRVSVWFNEPMDSLQAITPLTSKTLSGFDVRVQRIDPQLAKKLLEHS